jgi:hypothetical protein
MQRLFDEPARLAALSAGAIERAAEFFVSDRVDAFYRVAAAAIGAHARPAMLEDAVSCAS